MNLSKMLTVKSTKLREALKANKKYNWNDELQWDFQDIKKKVGNVTFLKPYNSKKKVYLQTDASEDSLGYVLYQYSDDYMKKDDTKIEERREERGLM